MCVLNMVPLLVWKLREDRDVILLLITVFIAHGNSWHRVKEIFHK